MGVLQATTGQMLVLFSLIAMGFIVAKLKVVPDNADTVLSKLENSLFVPALVLGTFASNFTVEKLTTAGKLVGISFVICFVMMGLAVLIARCCSKDSFIRNISDRRKNPVLHQARQGFFYGLKGTIFGSFLFAYVM